MKKSKNEVTESYRRLRNIIESYKNNNIKCISITSTSDLEGKTTITKNIAAMLANSGKNILFIDCNLPNKSEENGLVKILQDMNSSYVNDTELKIYINDTQCEHLSMLTLGTNNLDNYSSVFKTDNLKSVIERFKKNFDYIIIDMPSFKNLSYTQIIAGATDGYFFVLKEGINEVSEGGLIKEKLSNIGCKLLGCVLNKEKKPTAIFDEKYNSFFNMGYEGRKNRVLTSNKVTAKV
jgi:capsular exopolysaccharide synthesis family protein